MFNLWVVEITTDLQQTKSQVLFTGVLFDFMAAGKV